MNEMPEKRDLPGTDIHLLLDRANAEARRRRVEQELMARVDRRIELNRTVRRYMAAASVALLVALPAAATAQTQPYNQSGWESIDDAVALTREMLMS